MSETSETETEAQAKTQAPTQAPMPRYVALVATAWIGADGRRTLIAPGQPLPEEMSEHDRQQLIAARAARDNQQAQRQQRLQVVGHEERRRHAVEAEAGFQSEMPPPVHRQLGQADEKQCGAHDEQLLQERLVGQPAHPGFVDELQAAQQRERKQHHRAHALVNDAQLHAGDGVGGGALVGRQADAAGEGFGHGVAVPADVADLTAGQPETQDQRQQQESDEQEAEVQGLHATIKAWKPKTQRGRQPPRKTNGTGWIRRRRALCGASRPVTRPMASRWAPCSSPLAGLTRAVWSGSTWK